jgi:hypothetical protein
VLALGLGETDALTDDEGLVLALGLGETDALMLALVDPALGLADGLLDGLAEIDADGLRETEALTELDAETLGLVDALALALSLGPSTWVTGAAISEYWNVRPPSTMMGSNSQDSPASPGVLGLAEAENEELGLLLTLALGLREMLAETDDEGLWLPLGLAETDALILREADALTELDGVADADALIELDGLCERDSDAETDALGVGLTEAEPSEATNTGPTTAA